MIAATKKPKSKPDLIPAVAYIRMSSDEQEASPQQQRDEVARLAEKHGYTIVEEYIDEGISGAATNKRKGFLAMMAAAEKGGFEAILCWDQDRFGRFDSIEAGRWVHPLRERGIKLVTVAQGVIDWTNFAGRMIYSIQQEGKNQYLVDLSRNVLRGKIATAKKGLVNGRAPWGYDREIYDAAGKLMHLAKHGDGFKKPVGWVTRLVPTEDKAILGTIRWIFNTYVTTDIGLSGIAKQLTLRGTPSPQGVRWSATQVRQMLRCRGYVGDVVFGAIKKGKFHNCGPDGEVTKKNGHASTDPVIVREKCHKGIIDQKTFDLAQEKLNRRAVTRQRSRDTAFILTGVIRCGCCGSRMNGRAVNKPGRRYLYYVCLNASRYGDCPSRLVPVEQIEGVVLGAVEERLFASGNLDRLREEIEKAVGKLTKGNTSDRKASEREIAALEKKIDRVRENMLTADPDDVPAAQELLRKMKDQLKALRDSQTGTAAPLGIKPATLVKQAMAEIGLLRKRLGDDDPRAVRAALQEIFESVTLFWEGNGRARKVCRAVLSFYHKERKSRRPSADHHK